MLPHRILFAACVAIAAAIACQPAAAAPAAPATSAAPARPNVIFILADDLGYGDLGAFFQNGRRAAADRAAPAHLTPNLDAMAAGGVRLTDHYCSAPVCAPARASLLLGVHQGHANVRDNQFDKALEDNHTLATVLRHAGYATGAVGKWGLQGKPNTRPPDWPAHPLNRGFDDYYGYVRHADGHEHYPKEGVYRGAKEVWDNRTEVSAGLDKCYTTDLFAARAKKWVVDHAAAAAATTRPAKPFFLYLAFDTPHAACELPTTAYPAGGGLVGGLQWAGKPGGMINTAGGTVDGWYHPDYAAATYDDDGNPATPEVPWPDVYKRYATSVRRIDDAIGDLLHLLKDLKIDDNTLVVFTSDNGPSIESYLKDQPYRPTFFGSYGPFDGIKRDCWEGGLRVPTVARWPAAIPTGRVSKVPSSFPDWMPTLAALAGVPAPARSDGVSLLPALTGSGSQAEPRVYVEYFEGGRTPKFDAFEPARRNRLRRQMQALRIGDYVGVRYDVAAHADPFEIYDAVNDPKQARNLAARPDMAALQQRMKDTVLRVRRPSADAPRPYDTEPLPPVAAPAAKPGLAWQAVDRSFPWAPQWEAIGGTNAGVSPLPDPSAVRPKPAAAPAGPGAGGLAVHFSGFVEVPADGAYTFFVSADAAALLRVHEATVVDADYGHVVGGEVAGSILLKAGRHPIALSYARQAGGGAGPRLTLSWAGPGGEKRQVPAEALSHAAGPSATVGPR
ncbi:MAG: sulfatase [Phycisphaerales bacterium]|nr:sulfatase [Phycisphaerales bacterium]